MTWHEDTFGQWAAYVDAPPRRITLEREGAWWIAECGAGFGASHRTASGALRRLADVVSGTPTLAHSIRALPVPEGEQ